MNETSAKEWLIKAWHHYSSGVVLYGVNHYTDVIAVDLHYSAETTLKAILAYQNKKISKVHDLNELAKLVENMITFNQDEYRMMVVMSHYHIKDSYPTPLRRLPTREEIKEAMEFTKNLFEQVCILLHIPINEIKAQ